MPKDFDARKYICLAVEVMQKSIADRRKDGKINPKVGAVLVFPDGSVETAFRGELRDGDHAEFTPIERKCINSRNICRIVKKVVGKCPEK